MSGSPADDTFDYLYMLAEQGEYAEIVDHIRTHDEERHRYGAAGVLAESVTGFAEQSTPEARQALIESVLTDPSERVRATVVRVLLDIDESITDNIITRLEANPQSAPRETPYPLILTEWQSSRHPELRFLAVVGYENVASQSTIAKLRTAIINEQDMRVLRRAIEAGGTVGDATFVTPIQDHLRAADEEFKRASDKEAIKRIKQAAVEALVDIGTDAAYEALVTATRTADEDLKEQVVSEIGRFGAIDTVELIVDELDANDESVHREAAEGVITTFREADFDEGHTIREQAIQKMAEDVSRDVSAEFVSIVEESPYESERRNAAWLLGQLESHPQIELGTQATIDCLLSALHDDDRYLRDIATAALTTFDPEDAEPKIDTFLAETDEDSKAHSLASFVKASMQDTADEAKKHFVDYVYVASPSDYTAAKK
jgi:HEAT repeat protein